MASVRFPDSRRFKHRRTFAFGETSLKTALALAGITLLAGTGLVVTATGASAAPTPLLPAADAALKSHTTAVRASAKDAFKVYSSKTDAAGRGAVRYTRTYDGLRVYGG